MAILDRLSPKPVNSSSKFGSSGFGKSTRFTTPKNNTQEKAAATFIKPKTGSSFGTSSRFSAPKEEKTSVFHEKHLGPAADFLDKNKQLTQPLFTGKTQISRREMRRALKVNKAVEKAGKETGFDLKKDQRAKLEKNVFSKSLGKTITKSEFKKTIGKMEVERKRVEDPGQRGKLAKEIEFFKKIGGI